MNLGKRFKGNFSQRRRDAAGERTSRSRFTPVFETLLGVALLLGLSAFTPSLGWGLLNLQPHPLWIVILAIAVRYGGGSGYFAGGVTGAVYALLLWTRPEAHRQPLETHMLIQPFLMFATGGILGEIARA
ncbi:MAG TPA: hypothetical protein VHM28_08250, partial [Anaerolineales bacterium]|nr:hypothetical protein [Anaerolineales bacterium]